MKVISKTILQINPMQYLQAVETKGEELVITNEGRPVLKIVSYKPALTVDEAFADVRGKIRYLGDLLEPATDEWEVT